jgi:hypothetical protein
MLLTVGLVLSIVGTAWADCGWVLWDEYATVTLEGEKVTRQGQGFLILDATESKAECLVVLQQEVRSLLTQHVEHDAQQRGAAGNHIIWHHGEKEAKHMKGSDRLLCYPAALDPRLPR